MDLSTKLQSFSEEYWTFNAYRNEKPLMKYPAVMVAPMQERILYEVFRSDPNIRIVMDPFMGTGTVLCEAQKFSKSVIGIDINPLATLLSEVRLKGIPKGLYNKSISDLFTRITLLNGNVEPYIFDGIHKWFRPDITASLSIVRDAILREENEQIRKFFWCCFAETVKRYSNTRTSTFKLHIKPDIKIQEMQDNVVDFFKAHILEQAELYVRDNYANDIEIICGDARTVLSLRKEESVDLICTSPPYGDNATTVTYGQFSILPLLWIDRKDLHCCDSKLFENMSAIDSASLGGHRRKKRGDEQQYEQYTSKVSENKKSKIETFFTDYEEGFKQMTRVLRQGKYLVLTLGNRRVDNCEIRFDEFNDYLANKYGLILDSMITRRIVGKRMPRRVSTVQGVGAVDSMSKEYVKIYRKA